MLSRIRPRKTLVSLLVGAATALYATASIRGVQSALEPAPPVAAESPQPLDFEFFKVRVQPIFLKKRTGHARCYVCHESSRVNVAFRLEKLSPGSTFWTEEQSHRNFQNVSQFVVPGKPTSSWLLMHPLAPEAGGHAFHSGGRQFASENDPDWQTIAEWVRGQKAVASGLQTESGGDESQAITIRP